jgi:HAD superfamily hydrolase (TIGR01549 family)
VILEVVTLDCWGTLVDHRHTCVAERLAHLQSHLPAVSEGALLHAYETALTRFREVERLGFSLNAASMLSLTLDTLGATLPVAAYQDTLRYWEEVLLESPPPLLPGVAELLPALRARGLRLALISDTGLTPGRVMRPVLRGLGLLSYLEHCAFSDELGVTKRHAHPFASTLAALGVPPDSALHVGDNVETDVLGAQRAGLRAALLCMNGQRAGAEAADHILTHPLDLLEALSGER